MRTELNLKAIVRSYVNTCRPRSKADLEWFRQQPTLEAAVENAALAKNRVGKRHSHQRRLKKVALEEAKNSLLRNLEVISRSRDFDELFTMVERIVEPINGIGELYVYDTSLHIGAKMNLYPTLVYLHAGTRIGAQALGFDGKSRTLEMSALPEELHILAPHEVEDLLCIFKDTLKKLTP
jgi:hypothetical protein